MENIEEQAAVFSALGDPTRLTLLRILHNQQAPDALCVGALTGLLGISQPAVSQHLRILRTVGLVKGQKRGYHVHYSVEPAGLKLCQEFLSEILGPSGQAQEDPCRNCHPKKS